MIDLVQVHADIVRCYGSDPGEWDSDFLLKATPDEMVAYVLHFHGLAPDFNTGHDWVSRFGGWVDDFSYGDEFFDALWNLPSDVQSNVFAHLCVSIYAMSCDADPVHWSYELIGDWQTEGEGTSAHNEEQQLCEIGLLPSEGDDDSEMTCDVYVSICSHTDDDSRKWVILYKSIGWGVVEVEGMIPTEKVGEVSEVLWGLVQMARPWFESRRGFVDRGMKVPDSVMRGVTKSYDDLYKYVREVTS